MSLSSEAARIAYSITTSPQSFSVPFYFLNSSDLAVVATSNGVDTPLMLHTDYMVSGAGTNPSTGQVLGITGRTGQTLTIYRNAALTQPTTFIANSQLPSSTIEQCYDRVTMTVQQLSLKVARALRLPMSNSEAAEMPLISRKNKILGFDASGNPTFLGQVTATVVSGNMQQVSSVAALRALSVTGAILGYQAQLSGYYNPNDGGDGMLYYDPSSVATDDGGSVFKPDSVSGAGRWIRPLEAVVDVRKFGAKIDGLSNDGPKIAAAIAALPAKGGEIIIPPGTCVTDPIVLPSFPKAIRLHGTGQSTTVTPSGANQPLIIAATPVTNDACPQHYVSDLNLKAHASGSTGPAVDMRGMTGCRLCRLSYESNGTGQFNSLFFMSDVARPADAWTPVHAFGSCYVNIVEDVIIRKQIGPTYVVKSDNTAQANTLRRISVSSINSGMTAAIWLDGRSSQWLIDGCHFEGISNATAIIPTKCTTITGCYFEDTSSSGMVFLDGKGSFSTGVPCVTLIGCQFSTSNVSGKILFPNTSGQRAMGWIFDNCVGGNLFNLAAANARNISVQTGSIHHNLAIGKLRGGLKSSRIDPPGFQAPVKIPNQAAGLGAGSYSWKITSVNSAGESTATNFVVNIGAGEAPCQVILRLLPAEGACSYRIYGRTAGTEALMTEIYPENADGVGILIDDGAITPAGATAPTLNTTDDVTGVGYVTFGALRANDEAYFSPGDTTPSVTGRTLWNIGASDTITNFDDARDWQTITLRAVGANPTIQNNANIRLAGNVDFVMNGNSTITLVRYTDKWVETGRAA